MPFSDVLSTAASSAQAVADVCGPLKLVRGPADLAVVFFSPHHADNAATIAAEINDRLQPRNLIGCIGEAIVGGRHEIEQRPALSVWLARWDQPVDIVPFHLTPQQTPDGLSLLGWPDQLVDGDEADTTVLTLGDPFTFPATEIFLPQVNADCRGVPVFGGMASGMPGPGETPLILNNDVHTLGAVGVLLRGPTGARGIVSQGCRPIGKPFVVTKVQDHHILELGGRPSLEQLQATYEALSSRDQELFQRGPHVGLVVNEYLPKFERGDFLVRNVYAIDRASGAMTITDRARVGQTIQFHLRDADTADEDLRLMLRAAKSEVANPAAALMFTCNGRGTRLFDAPNHDATAVHDELGSISLAGFFAAGELGPIGGQNFLHGFTASIVVFE